MLYEKINNDLKEAMRNRNSEIANSLRIIKSRISEYLVQEKLKRDVVQDDVVITVITSHKKSLGKAIDQLLKGGEKANNLIEEYKREIGVCNMYLPDDSQLSKNLEEIVVKAISELGVNDEKQAGRVVGYIMKNNSGLDGKMVKEVVFKKIRG